jgi:uncharacterized membrane-anchored protein
MDEKVLTKVPEVTLIFWIVKIAATTLGETGGDTVSMTLNWGYLVGTIIFLTVLAALVVWQTLAKKFHPFLYWEPISPRPPPAPQWPISPTAPWASATPAARLSCFFR